MPKRPENRVVLLTAFIFLIACATPAIVFPNREPNVGGQMGPFGVMWGVEVLCKGWILAFLATLTLFENLDIRVSAMAWFANPILLAGWVLLLCRRHLGAIVAGMFALFLGCWYLIDPVPVGARPLLGSYIWVISMAAMTFGAVLVRPVARRKPASRDHSDQDISATE